MDPGGTPNRKPGRPRNRDPSHIPRPTNSFIMYRLHVLPDVQHRYASLPMEERRSTSIANILSEQWANESAEVKALFAEKAAQAREEHRQAHPDYVFRPDHARAMRPTQRRSSESSIRRLEGSSSQASTSSSASASESDEQDINRLPMFISLPNPDNPFARSAPPTISSTSAMSPEVSMNWVNDMSLLSTPQPTTPAVPPAPERDDTVRPLPRNTSNPPPISGLPSSSELPSSLDFPSNLDFSFEPNSGLGFSSGSNLPPSPTLPARPIQNMPAGGPGPSGSGFSTTSTQSYFNVPAPMPSFPSDRMFYFDEPTFPPPAAPPPTMAPPQIMAPPHTMAPMYNIPPPVPQPSSGIVQQWPNPQQDFDFQMSDPSTLFEQDDSLDQVLQPILSGPYTTGPMPYDPAQDPYPFDPFPFPPLEELSGETAQEDLGQYPPRDSDYLQHPRGY